MTSLAGFNAEEHKPLGSFEAIPKDKYIAIATDSEMKDTSKKNGQYLQITWEIVDGEHKGRTLWSRLNLDNPNEKAVEIAQRELADICRAVGKLRPSDSNELHGVPVMLDVGVETRKDNGELTNRVKGYEPVTGSTPSAATRKAAASDNGGTKKAPWQK